MELLTAIIPHGQAPVWFGLRFGEGMQLVSKREDAC